MSPKRVRTLSKNGIIYYKNSPEVNREGQKKYYNDHKENLAPQSVLNRLEKIGNVPQFASVKKYPSYINEESIMRSYRAFKEHNDDPEKYIVVRDKINKLIKKIDSQKNEK